MNKSLMFLAAFLLTLPALAQTDFQIRGKIGKLPAPAKVYIGYNADGKTIYDSAFVENGTFHIRQQVPYPVNALLTVSRDGERKAFFNGNDIAHIYIEPGSIIWLISDENIANFDYSGSKSQDDYKAYLAFTADVQNKILALTKESSNTMQNDRSEQGIAAKRDYMARFRGAMDERKQKMKEFVQMHPNMYISLDILEEYAGNFIDYREVEPLYKSLHETTKNSTRGKAFLKKINLSKQTAIGADAPDFSQKDAEGNKLTLSALKGKVVLLNFWASWSSTSRAESQEIKDIVKNYNEKELAIVNVGLEQRRDEWMKALAEDKMVGYNTTDLKFLKNEIAELYNVTAVPQNVLIDKDGKIVGRNLKGSQLAESLKSVLGK
jgi:thiol-disulfide isomerase/thioredoxin